jgi:hypothetical protein
MLDSGSFVGHLYDLVNDLDSLIYVGATTNPHKRWAKHKTDAHSSKTLGHPLYDAMKRDGIAHYRMVLVGNPFATRASLKEAEVARIVALGSWKRELGHNVHKTGTGRPLATSSPLHAKVVSLYRSSGLTALDLAAVLERSHTKAPSGGDKWHPSTITRILAEAGIKLPRGRPPDMRIRTTRPSPSPLHIVTQIAWRRRTKGSGSDLWRLLELEGKWTPPASPQVSV